MCVSCVNNPISGGMVSPNGVPSNKVSWVGQVVKLLHLKKSHAKASGDGGSCDDGGDTTGVSPLLLLLLPLWVVVTTAVMITTIATTTTTAAARMPCRRVRVGAAEMRAVSSRSCSLDNSTMMMMMMKDDEI